MTRCERLSDTSTAVLWMRPEKCWGDAAPGPMRPLRMTSENLGFEISTTVSNEIDPAAQRSDLIQTGAQASGDVEFELSFGTFEDLMQATLRSTWRSPGQRVIDAEDVAFVAPATITSSLTDLSVFPVGTLVTIRGAANCENNPVSVRVTASSGSSLTLDLTTIVSEAAGQKIQIHSRGQHGDDFTATAPDSIGSTAVDLSAWPAGALVRVSGFATEANNGLFAVETAAASALTLAESTLASEAGPASVTLWLAGVRHNGIQAVASGNRLLSDGNIAWTDFALIPGQWLRLSGFGLAGNNGFARIAGTPTATELPLDGIVLADENAGGSATVTVEISHLLRNGIERRSFVLEREIRDKGYFWCWSGMVPNSMSLNIGTGEILTGSFNFMGKREDPVAQTSSGTGDPGSATLTPVINAVSNVAKVIENGQPSPVYFSALSIEATNNLRAQNAIGTLGAIGIGYGVSEVTGSLTAFFSNPDFYNKFIDNTETSIAFCIRDAEQNGYVFSMPRVKFSSGGAAASGVGEDFTVEMGYQALKTTDGSGTTLQIDRFPTITP